MRNDQDNCACHPNVLRLNNLLYLLTDSVLCVCAFYCVANNFAIVKTCGFIQTVGADESCTH